MAKYIPGTPTIVVENMPGAGSIIAANYTYNVAKPDGLTIGLWISELVLHQLLGETNVKVDGRKVGWIGSAANTTYACAIMGFTGLRTFEDIVKSKKPIKMGGQAAGEQTVVLPKILNKMLGTNFQVISGYKGTSEMRLAMQSREIDGACWGWESMKSTAKNMLDAEGDAKLIPFVIHRKVNDPPVRDLPVISNLITDESNSATYRAWAAPAEFFRPFAAPPGVPKERLDILRKAFKSTLEDKEFLVETKKSNLEINYLSGEEIEKLVNLILNTPPKLRQNLRTLMLEG
jgi:tripartite-type tricarboxylate transporter receptor subunit TctC